VGERFDEQDRSARCQGLRATARRGDRVAHVVQGVEEADEAVLFVGYVHGACIGEERAITQALGRGELTRFPNGLAMRVEAVEAGIREGLGHEERRVAVPAADVTDLDADLELWNDTF
jgi:hypothetical protein